MKKPFFEPPPNIPGFMAPPGPTDAEVISQMKAAYLKEHPECTDDDLDVKVDHVSRSHTNFTLVVKPKISGIKINVYIDHKEHEEDVV
jgi:hypothetical protein